MKTNHFDQFQMEHLSASSLNLFVSNLPLFIVRYLHKFKAPTNAAMLRGTTVDKFIGKALQFAEAEDGGWEKTEEQISDEVLLERADNYFTAAIDDLDDTPEKVNAELNNVNKYLKVGLPFYKALGSPQSYQKRVELDIDLPIPIIGFSDLEYTESVRDIKTSARAPSELTPQVSRQLAIYAVAMGKSHAWADYLVVTKTKELVISLACDDINMRFDEVYRAAHALNHLLLNNDLDSLIAQTYPDFSDWRWDKQSAEEARKLWRIK